MDHLDTRAEYLSFCKTRALDLCDSNPQEAITSMLSDMKEHPDTADHPALTLAMSLMMTGHLSTSAEARRFIEGFN